MLNVFVAGSIITLNRTSKKRFLAEALKAANSFTNSSGKESVEKLMVFNNRFMNEYNQFRHLRLFEYYINVQEQPLQRTGSDTRRSAPTNDVEKRTNPFSRCTISILLRTV